MKKYFYSLIFVFIFLIVPKVVFGATLFDSQTSYTTSGAFTNNPGGFSYNFTTSKTIDKVDFYFHCGSSGVVQSCIASSNTWSSCLIYSQNTIAGCDYNWDWRSFTFNNYVTGIGTKYILIKTTSGSGPAFKWQNSDNHANTGLVLDGVYYSGYEAAWKLYEFVIVCGDGVVSGSEQCDDGNTQNGDGCSSTCTNQPCVCGNGITQFYTNQYGTCREYCDDGNLVSGDGCNRYCDTEIPGKFINSASSSFNQLVASSTVGFTDGFSKLLQMFFGLIIFILILNIIFKLLMKLRRSVSMRKPFIFEIKKHNTNYITNRFDGDTPISRREMGLFSEIKSLRKQRKNKYE